MRSVILLCVVFIAWFPATFSSNIRGVSMTGDNIPTYIRSAFHKFKAKFHRVYSTQQEEAYRLSVFYDFFKRIKKISDQGHKHFTVGITKFADLTKEEFVAEFVGKAEPKVTSSDTTLPTKIAVNPTEVDWQAKGAVNDVPFQGTCDASSYFAATGSIEGAAFIKSGTLPSLSVQQIIDCSFQYGNKGCKGGETQKTLQYAVSMGLESDADYPYRGSDNVCRYDMTKIAVKPSDRQYLPSYNQDLIAASIAMVPVAGMVDAHSDIFQGYTSGVITSPDCGTQPSHGMLITGYKSDASPPYFRYRNSWGADWGEDGYVRIQYDVGAKSSGVCSLAIENSYAIL